MATKKKSSRKRVTSLRKSARAKSVRRGMKKASSTRGKQSKVARATRVARGVVQQATVAVVTGVDTLKEFGGNLVDRVRGEQ